MTKLFVVFYDTQIVKTKSFVPIILLYLKFLTCTVGTYRTPNKNCIKYINKFCYNY